MKLSDELTFLLDVVLKDYPVDAFFNKEKLKEMILLVHNEGYNKGYDTGKSDLEKMF